MAITARDRAEFRAYLRQCTDRQVIGCFEKERDAGRDDYRELCQGEAERRGLELPAAPPADDEEEG